MSPIAKWFKSILTDDPRRSSRRKTPPLVAYFWDGGQPVAHAVQNISPTGFYLGTDERWLLGTLIMMTLQRTKSGAEQSECSVIVMSKVVRYGEDGVGFAFVPVETATPGQQPGPGSHAADRRTLDKFLDLLKSDAGYAHLGYILLLLLPLLAVSHALRDFVFVSGLILIATTARSRIVSVVRSRTSTSSRRRV